MAHFRGTVEGSRGEASRLGSKDSGLRTTANGWECGVEVDAAHDVIGDVFYVYLTGGSNARNTRRLIARVFNGTADFFPEFPADEIHRGIE
jgi:hypothetical protein